MPKFRISEQYYGNGINVAVGTGCVAPDLKTTNCDYRFCFKYIINSIISCLYLFLPDLKQKKLRIEPIFDIL